tara:strand:- start:7887 stop:8069 length:183 start_codon:yes stop_codon:yes gene_type:complete
MKKLDKAQVDKLKAHFHKAKDVGGETLRKGHKLIVKNPVQSALFTLLAANIIKRTKSRKH